MLLCWTHSAQALVWKNKTKQKKHLDTFKKIFFPTWYQTSYYITVTNSSVMTVLHPIRFFCNGDILHHSISIRKKKKKHLILLSNRRWTNPLSSFIFGSANIKKANIMLARFNVNKSAHRWQTVHHLTACLTTRQASYPAMSLSQSSFKTFTKKKKKCIVGSNLKKCTEFISNAKVSAANLS